jgi:ATP-dependent Clp protease ATP-binding subunit ClpA
MRACNVDLEKLRHDLIAYIESELENPVTDGSKDAKQTESFHRAIQRAVTHAQSVGRETVTGAARPQGRRRSQTTYHFGHPSRINGASAAPQR